jgi:hypothetical protein
MPISIAKHAAFEELDPVSSHRISDKNFIKLGRPLKIVRTKVSSIQINEFSAIHTRPPFRTLWHYDLFGLLIELLTEK